MPESEPDTRAVERLSKPVVPPFGGPVGAVGRVLRPAATDLRGRKTMPPFFAAPVRLGGPLPGASSNKTAPPLDAAPVVTAEPEPAAAAVDVAEPEAVAVAVSEGARERAAAAVSVTEPTRAAEPTPPPSWDTPAMPVAVAPPEMDVATPGSSTPSSVAAQRGADWGPPMAPEPGFQAETQRAADQAAIPAPARPAPLPPTHFEDSPLASLPPSPEESAEPQLDVTAQARPDDITEMFAEPYTPEPQAAVQGMGGARRPARRTPALGTIRRQGRRATPVLGSQAITPMTVPTIRRTSMAGGIAAIEPAATGLEAPRSSPTPIAVPVLHDLVASRAVAHALETVAARVRAGQLVVTAQIPIGSDTQALAAAVAAALAALLGVQQ